MTATEPDIHSEDTISEASHILVHFDAMSYSKWTPAKNRRPYYILDTLTGGGVYNNYSVVVK